MPNRMDAPMPMHAMSAAGGSGSGEECEGEDAEDSSSLSLNTLILHSDVEQQAAPEDALATFRQQWQRELSSPQRGLQQQRRPDGTEQVESEEEKAKKLFLQGVESERTGALDEAVRCYRRALQLVPDIEFRLHESWARRTTPLANESDEASASESEIEDTALREEERADSEDGDLLTRMQRIVARNGVICIPQLEQKGTHISRLPYEVFLLLLRWVVSSELDAMSLERAGAVCRGLYVATRDPEIWRMLCVRTWGLNCGPLKGSPWSSWRRMYIERPHLRFHGCYISKTSYLRQGENCFQDQFYKPWHFIQYYRYLRFFPEGAVLMLTTAEEPAACVPHLKQRVARTDHPVLSGRYRLFGDKVVIVVKKASGEKKPAQATNTRFRSRRYQPTDQSQQTFHLELQVCSQKWRRNSQLVWSGYKVTTRNKNDTESSSTFELSGPKFPPFWFSMVRSYHAESESPLA